MYKIKFFGKVSNKAKELLKENYIFDDKLEDYDAILVHSTSLHDLQFPKSLKAIIRVGAGTNNIPISRCTENGIAVFNTPGGNANAVKELTIAAMINITRNIQNAKDFLIELSKQDEDFSKGLEKAKELYKGTELIGKTVVIFGVGAIGQKLAKNLYDIGMKVFGYDPWLNDNVKNDLKQYITFKDSIDELLKIADYITLHLPANKENENFINEDIINKMKDNAFVINYARGQLVDHKAILNALNSGKLKGYATDFPTKEEIGNSHVFATPHLGADTIEANENCSSMALNQMREYLENGNVINSTNFPNINIEKHNNRINILHKNSVGMLGKITSIISEKGMNIEKLSNQAREDIAYTIVDFDCEIVDGIKEEIERIDEVMMVRIV